MKGSKPAREKGHCTVLLDPQPFFSVGAASLDVSKLLRILSRPEDLKTWRKLFHKPHRLVLEERETERWTKGSPSIRCAVQRPVNRVYPPCKMTQGWQVGLYPGTPGTIELWPVDHESCSQNNRNSSTLSTFSFPCRQTQQSAQLSFSAELPASFCSMHAHRFKFRILQETVVSEKFRQKWPSGSSSGIYFCQTSVVARLLFGRLVIITFMIFSDPTLVVGDKN